MFPKSQIHNRFLQFLNDKADALNDRIAALAEDSRNDAKGSAGDKHETALSMMQLEQEKLAANLRETMHQLETMKRIDPEKACDRVMTGSLVRLNAMTLYVGLALPKITVENTSVIGISPSAPLALAISGKRAGEIVLFNGSVLEIKEIS